MNLLKRKASADADLVVVEPVPEKPGGKNAPTPKREQARAERAKKAKGAPRSRKERAARVREIRAESVAALKSTDPAKLPANERVPELVLARDLIDSRRNPASFMLPVFAVYFVGTFVQVAAIRTVLLYFSLAWFFIMIIDTVVLARRVTTRVRARFPGSSARLGGYTFRRAFAPKRWRRPVVRPDIPEQNQWAYSQG